MSIEEIRVWKHAQPFRPFAIVRKDGTRLHIEEPIRIALSPVGDSVAGFAREGSFFCPLSQIAEVRAARRRKTKAA